MKWQKSVSNTVLNINLYVLLLLQRCRYTIDDPSKVDVISTSYDLKPFNSSMSLLLSMLSKLQKIWFSH